jgi:hypothetical protein
MEETMQDDKPVIATEFAASFKGFMDTMTAQAPRETPFFWQKLSDHFGADLSALQVVSEIFPRPEHPNVHLALTSYLDVPDRSHELFGMQVPNEHMGIKLAHLMQKDGQEWSTPKRAPVEYVNVTLDDERVLACVKVGLYLVRDGEQPLAVLVQGPSLQNWGPQLVSVEVLATERETAEAFLHTIRRGMRARNVYRGHVISLDSEYGNLAVKFHRLPRIERDGIILPQGVIDRIERHTVGFARAQDKLLKAKRHLKRGLLLYGPPGTGKTLTAMYLASLMPDRTVILLTGHTIGAIDESCKMARLLQPSTVILEDVDLIAEERTHQSTSTNAVLFDLLNQMDGLADDMDVLFLLTTNRPEILEPALASRPGRVDQAILVPLPDAECRARLIDLYSDGMQVRLSDREALLSKTDGVSAAFIRELMRKAALFAAESGASTGDDLVVEDAHVNDALHELVVEGGELTQQLLGASRPSSRAPGC